MFQPPFCPRKDCTFNRSAPARFYTSHGTYAAKCRTAPIPRFRCRACERTFSVQTFRADYCDNKPWVNHHAMDMLASGLGFRRTAKLVGLSRRCLELKARKLSREARQLDRNLRARASRAGRLSLHFDELETYETRRNTRPLTVATVIESASRFLFAALAGPIRPRGKMTAARRAALAEDERRFGIRQTRSNAVCLGALKRAAAMVVPEGWITIHTDFKSTYPGLVRRAFKGRGIVHLRTPSVMPRGKRNPLFPINNEEACLRDRLGRLRRESWLVSKRRRFLNLHLALYMAVRNYVRPRFNRDEDSPAQICGFVPRRLELAELFAWRQAWGRRSLSPLEASNELGYEQRAVAFV